MAATFSSMITEARKYWGERNPREQRMVCAMVLVVGVAILWSLIDWQRSETARLDKAIPSAQAQVKTMQEHAAELARLRSQPTKPAFNAAQVLVQLQSSASAQKLALTIKDEGSRIVISGEGIDFDHWVPWLANAQSTHGLKASSLQASGENGAEKVQAILEPAK